jgi:PIN domain nuclease of toxin-antitoxin system
MRVLADTNLFIKFCNELPLPSGIEDKLNDEATERCVSAISVVEIFRLWKKGELKENPDTWLDLALPSWTVLNVNASIARQSVLWNWEHKDPADRIIAATAMIEDVELWHTDTVIKQHTGFPHRYFKNVV